MNFADYLWQLLPPPFKKLFEEVFKYVQTLGGMLDSLKTAIFTMRRNWFVRIATGQALDVHGEDRGIKRQVGESDADYQRRLVAAFEFYQAGGTRKGVLRAIADATSVTFSIREYQRECWKLGRGRLGRNTRLMAAAGVAFFGVYFDRVLTADEAAKVRAALDEAAPPHTNFQIVYPPAIEQRFWKLGRSHLGVNTRLR